MGTKSVVPGESVFLGLLPALRGAPVSLLVALVGFARGESAVRVSFADLSRVTGYHRSHIHRGMTCLEKHGLIKRRPRAIGEVSTWEIPPRACEYLVERTEAAQRPLCVHDESSGVA